VGRSFELFKKMGLIVRCRAMPRSDVLHRNMESHESW
jgi:hypothetical protein